MESLKFSSDHWTSGDSLSDMPSQDRYIIRVKAGEEFSPSDFVGAVQKIPGVDIVEGFGTRTLTVDMTPKAFLNAKKRFDNCIIQPHGLLNLL